MYHVEAFLNANLGNAGTHQARPEHSNGLSFRDSFAWGGRIIGTESKLKGLGFSFEARGLGLQISTGILLYLFERKGSSCRRSGRERY